MDGTCVVMRGLSCFFMLFRQWASLLRPARTIAFAATGLCATVLWRNPPSPPALSHIKPSTACFDACDFLSCWKITSEMSWLSWLCSGLAAVQGGSVNMEQTSLTPDLNLRIPAPGGPKGWFLITGCCNCGGDETWLHERQGACETQSVKRQRKRSKLPSARGPTSLATTVALYGSG